MSFLTMLGPSPDWNVGLSGEDFCTKDCGWVQKHVADLIPWDAGTDSGVTYEVWMNGVNSKLCVMDKVNITTCTDCACTYTFVSETCSKRRYSLKGTQITILAAQIQKGE